MIRTSTLDNGLQIVTEAMPGVQSVALSFWVGTGSRDESPQEAGLSHFLEHLLFKGSDTRTALDIAQTIDEVGGDMNAFTTKELTAFYVRVLAEDRSLALDILCDIMCAPAFDPKEVDAERQVVLEEILMRNDEPSDLVHEHLAQVLYGAHPLGRDILGTEALIESASADDVRTFFERHYRPQNLIFAAAGAIEHDEIVEAVAARWRGRDGGARPVRERPSMTTGTLSVHRRPTDQAHVVVAVPAPDRHSGDRYAAALLDVVLGGGMSSHLFQEVREKRGLAYTVYSSYGPYDDAGELSIYVGTAPKRAHEALSVVLDELRRMQEQGITNDELERAKRHLRSTTVLGLEDTTARMSRIGRSLLVHGDVLSVDEVSARVDAVSVEQVGELAARLLAVDPVVVAVGPLHERDLQVRGA